MRKFFLVGKFAECKVESARLPGVEGVSRSLEQAASAEIILDKYNNYKYSDNYSSTMCRRSWALAGAAEAGALSSLGGQFDMSKLNLNREEFMNEVSIGIEEADIREENHSKFYDPYFALENTDSTISLFEEHRKKSLTPKKVEEFLSGI